MIKIKTNSLKAATFIAPTKDVRYYLNGVQILVRNTGAVHVRATSGSILFDDCGPEKSVLTGTSFIIPVAVAKELAKEKTEILEFSLTEDGRWECAGRLFRPLDGAFPDCDRVIPSQVGADRAENYDFELLATAQKAMRAARGNMRGFYRVRNSETAGSAALICCEKEDFPRIVVMPLRPPRCFEGQ